MSTRHRSKIIIFCTVLVLFTSCKKELDFGLYNELPTLNGDYVAPFINTSIGLANLVDSNEQLIVDSTDLLSLYLRLDSVFSLDLNALVTIPEQSPQQITLDYSGVSPDDVLTQRDILFSEIVSSLDTATRDSLIANDGTVNYFPPIAAQGGGTFPVPTQTNFNYVNLNSGSFKLVLTNGFPVDLINLSFDVRNASDSSIVASLSVPLLAAGGVDSASVSLTNTLMEADLEVVLTNFESPGSGNDPSNTATHVFIDLTDEIGVDITLSNLDLDFGEVIIPQQDLPLESQSLVLGLGDGVEAERADLTAGAFRFTIERDLNAEIQIDLGIPGLSDNGVPFSTTITIPGGNGVFVDTLDLSGMVMDLTASSAANYNAIDITYQVKLPGTPSPVYISTSDDLSFSYQLEGLEFDYREGYFGNAGIQDLGFAAPLSHEFLDKINGSIILNDPKFRIFFRNSVGVPIGLNLQLEAFNSDGGFESLDILDFEIESPDKTQIGESVTSILDINKNTFPTIVNFLGILPDSLNAVVGMGLNPSGPDYDNFITPDGLLGLDLEIEIPLDFSASNFGLSDVASFDMELGDQDPNQFIEGVKLFFNIDNYFPIDASVDFILRDGVGAIVDTIQFNVLESATPDATGRVHEPVNYKQEVSFSGEELEKLLTATTIQVDVRFATFEEGAQPVKIYLDYTMDIKVAAEANLNYKPE